MIVFDLGIARARAMSLRSGELMTRSIKSWHKQVARMFAQMHTLQNRTIIQLTNKQPCEVPNSLMPSDLNTHLTVWPPSQLHKDFNNESTN